MTIEKKFKIDTTIIEILEKKNIDFRTILKSTIQFICAIDWCIEKDTEEILINIINTYSDYTLYAMSNKYCNKSSFFTKEQEKVYKKISSNNRKYILNELISISLNNSSYINVIDIQINTITQDHIINKFTLQYFTSFTKESKDVQYIIIGMMKSLLFKINRVINKNLVVESYYKELLILIFKEYKIKNEAIEILKNPVVTEFVYEEFGKIFFIMNIVYNMSLKNESEHFRKWKYKYEPILEQKYNNNIDKFIENEINLSTNISEEQQIEEFIYFMNEMHPSKKERFILFQILKIHICIKNNLSYNSVVLVQTLTSP